MWPTFQLNYLAVLTAAVAAFALGALWYSPALFAKAWVRAHGYSPADLERMQQGAARAYAVTLLCDLLLAAGLGILVSYLGLSRAEQGCQLGLLAWGGFALPLGLMAHVFSAKRPAAFMIDAAYQLVFLAVMGTILAVWR